MASCDCCGCVFATDYGTSTITGDGSSSEPFVLSTVDPAWQRPAAKATRASGNQTIATGAAFAAITFTAEAFDVGDFWSAGSPTRLTITESGIYIFGGAIRFVANATGTRELGFRLNGTQILQIVDQNVDPVNGGAITACLDASYQYRFNPGDYIELVARQETGGNLNTINDSEQASSFWIVYAGKTI